MTKTVLIYPPFATPASPPYSIANIYGFLKANLKDKIEVLDLNIIFHKKKFKDFGEFYKKKKYYPEQYSSKTKEYKNITEKIYSESNKEVVNGNIPEQFDEILKNITKAKPDIAAFSIVFSSQAFYTYSLIKELKKQGIRCVIGGPAVNSKLRAIADSSLNNELELLDYIKGEKTDHKKLNMDYSPDFTIFNHEDYFTPEPVIPLRTSSACYYRKCAFCTHHQGTQYYEYPLDKIKKAITRSKAKNFFITDDMIHKKRLLELATILKGKKWMAQLKPTKELDKKTFETLSASGLKIIIWGIESGSNRILKLMRKGTNIKDIKEVLKASHEAGIKNAVYIMFGFPTETKEEFLETIEFLKDNSDKIDIISTSIFGLQKGTPIYNNPEEFGISIITEEQRTNLDPKISYTVKTGLSQEEAKKLRRGYMKTIENINRFPKEMNFFREHLLCFV